MEEKNVLVVDDTPDLKALTAENLKETSPEAVGQTVKNLQDEAQERWRKKYNPIETKIDHAGYLKETINSLKIFRKS